MLCGLSSVHCLMCGACGQLPPFVFEMLTGGQFTRASCHRPGGCLVISGGGGLARTALKGKACCDLLRVAKHMLSNTRLAGVVPAPAQVLCSLDAKPAGSSHHATHLICG